MAKKDIPRDPSIPKDAIIVSGKNEKPADVYLKAVAMQKMKCGMSQNVEVYIRSSDLGSPKVGLLQNLLFSIYPGKVNATWKQTGNRAWFILTISP